MINSYSDLSPLVSIRRLERLLGFDRQAIQWIANRAGRYYRPFDVRRVGTRKWRHIDNPQGKLKTIQKRILTNILKTVNFPAAILGGIAGASIKENARVHLGQPILVVIDIKDFFPNITHRKAYSAYKTCLGCSAKIAGLLTKLTTFQRRIPQGAPTSTLLANMSVLTLHDELKELADNLGLRVTFWVDDIAFSGPNADKIIGAAVEIISRHGFAVSSKKIRVMGRGSRQEVTGVPINRKISAGRKYIEELRNSILDFKRTGITAHEFASLRSKISHVRWLCPSQGIKLEEFAKEQLSDLVLSIGCKAAKNEYRKCEDWSRHRREP
ncbi:MAG: RNA-directed DNA polymerase [Acidobacteria bacterium]|nr:MAG: RNA-directed DNA polymerase [Acidobacteriota bacterium]